MTFTLNLVNTRTGESIWFDAHQARLSRMRRRVHAWSQAMSDLYRPKQTRLVMITLTYEEVEAWRPKHISEYMKRLREKLDDELLAYAWVGEMQERGAVHYHMYILVQSGADVPRPDESGMWVHGSSRIETGRSPFYMVKYVGKEYQKHGYPKGMRMFAVGIRKDAIPLYLMHRFKMSTLPKWLRGEVEKLGVVALGLMPKPSPGGGWVLKIPADRNLWGLEDTETWFPSPWLIMR